MWPSSVKNWDVFDWVMAIVITASLAIVVALPFVVISANNKEQACVEQCDKTPGTYPLIRYGRCYCTETPVPENKRTTTVVPVPMRW